MGYIASPNSIFFNNDTLIIILKLHIFLPPQHSHIQDSEHPTRQSSNITSLPSDIRMHQWTSLMRFIVYSTLTCTNETNLCMGTHSLSEPHLLIWAHSLGTTSHVTPSCARTLSRTCEYNKFFKISCAFSGPFSQPHLSNQHLTEHRENHHSILVI